MNKEQILYILKENESLKLKLQRLEINLDKLQNRYNDAENELNSFKRRYEFLSSQFKEIVRQSFPREYIENKMSSYSEKEIYEFLLEKIRDLEQSNFENEQQRIDLTNQLNTLKNEYEKLKEIKEKIDNGDFSNYTINMQNNEEDKNEDENIIIENDVSTPLENIMNELQEKEFETIKIIGEGTTLFSDILNKLNIGTSNLADTLNFLQTKGIISFKKIYKGGKGRPSHHYFLTSLGNKIYEEKFNSQPQKTKLEELSTHGSPSHGGLIFEVGEFLKENGCDVSYDGPETTFKLKDGREIRFDIKAYDKETKETLFFEIERAKCGEDHLFDKFNKCLLFTKLGLSKTIYIVSPNREISTQILQSLFRWIRQNNDKLEMLQKNNLDKAGIIFRIGSFEDFKNGKLQSFSYKVKI